MGRCIDNEFEEWFKKSGYPDDLKGQTLVAWQASKAACWQAVSAKIKQGPLNGNGNDDTAERNGIIMAANTIIAKR